MPIRQLKPSTPVAPAKTPGLWERIGGLRGLLATGARVGAGLVGSTVSLEPGPGTLVGGAIGGGGEALAEMIEGTTPDWKRVGVEAALTATPLGRVFRGARTAAAVKSALLSGAGVAGRDWARDETISPTEFGAQTAIGAGLGALLGGRVPAASRIPKTKDEYQAWKVAEAEPKQWTIEQTSRGGIDPIAVRQASVTRPRTPSNIQIQPRTPTVEPILGTPIVGTSAEASGRVGKIVGKENAAITKEVIRDQQNLKRVEQWVARNQAAKAKAAEQATAAEQIAAEKEGLVPQPPSVSESISAPIPGGRERMTTAFRPPKEEKPTPLEELLRVISGEPVTPAKPRTFSIRRQAPVRIPETWTPPYGEVRTLPEAPPVAAPAPIVPKPVVPSGAAAEVPTAKYVFDQPDVGPMYNIVGGPLDRSTVSAGKLQELGIPIPETTVPQIPPRPVSLSAVEHARATFPDEVNAVLDDLAAKRASGELARSGEGSAGAQMAEIRDFMSGKKMRESWRGAPVAPSVTPSVPPAVPTLSQKLEETLAPPAPRVSKIGPGQTAKAREAALAARKAKQAEVVPVPEGGTPPAQAKKFEALFNKLRVDKLKGEKGEVNPALLAKLGLGAGGAVIGAAENPEDRVGGALLGGAAGLGLAYAPQMLQSLGAHPGTFENLSEKLNVEGVKTVAKKIFDTLPQIQRFNYLASAYGLPANIMFGPYGSAVMGALEHGLAGDPRGWAALKTLKNPATFFKDIANARIEARTLLEHGELGRAEGMGAVTTKFQQGLEQPGIYMTAGDVAARRHLEAAGFTEAEARRITLTSEPELQLPKGLVNLGKGRSDATKTITNILVPFRRTPANIWEQGMERFPVLGFWIQNQRDIPDPIKQQIMQQFMSGGVAAASAVAGASLDPETAKQVRRYLTNFAGQYSMLASMGFTAGQAYRANKPVITAGLKGMTDLPLPSVQPVNEWANFIFNQGPAPSGSSPAILKELFAKPTTPTPKPLIRLRRLR